MMAHRSFNFVENHKNISLVERGHVPAFIYEDTPIIFDPGVSAFGPLYHKKLIPIVQGKKKPLMILLTHSHFDHCGAAPYLLRKFLAAQVGASTRAAEVLQKQSAIDLIRRFNAEYEEKLAHELVGEDTSFPGIAVDLLLGENDAIAPDEGTCIQVIETPGHTRDCLSYFFPETGVMIAGEAAGVPEEDFIHSVFLASYEDYVSSIAKLQRFDIAALCIAHVGILVGNSTVKKYLSASRAAAQEYRAKIERYLEKFDGDRDTVVNTIVAEEYDPKPRHIVNRNPFIANIHAKINAICKLADHQKALHLSGKKAEA